jgi:hypothetical protein
MSKYLSDAALAALIERAADVSADMVVALRELQQLRARPKDDPRLLLHFEVTWAQARGLSLIANRLRMVTITDRLLGHREGSADDRRAIANAAASGLAALAAALSAQGVSTHSSPTAPRSTDVQPKKG